MNDKRRAKISAVKSRLFNAQQDIDQITCDEQECFDALPENFQEAERGWQMQNAIDALDEASNLIETAMEKLSEATE